jgi:hypothetical protein
LPNRAVVCKGLRERSVAIRWNVFYLNVLRAHLGAGFVKQAHFE